MKVYPAGLEGCLLLEPDYFTDNRGAFQELFQQQRYYELGITAPLLQDNFSRSVKGVLRGLHFQRSKPQGKLITVLRGEIFDVMVDIRPASASFKKWYGLVLSDKKPQQLWIPPGFAHGFQVLSAEADIIYKCSEYYDPADEGSICWNDPDLAIEWPVAAPLLSVKDANAPTLALAGLS